MTRIFNPMPIRKLIFRIISLSLIFSLLLEQSGLAQVTEYLDISRSITGMFGAQHNDVFRPTHLRYLSIPEKADSCSVIIDRGSQKTYQSAEFTKSVRQLLDYFLTGVALPNEDFWVNLRPDDQANIIDPELAKTDAGRILLEADLQLKKDLASLTSPQTPEGKVYWDSLYQKAEELFGSQMVTIPTIVRPWIVPGEVVISSTPTDVYVYKANLKVMLEEDYLKGSSEYSFKDSRMRELNEYSAELIRSLILPKLTEDINSAKRYASLRQVFYSLILAQWFKQYFRGDFPSYQSRINRRDLSGLESAKPWSVEDYFNAYRKSFQEGEYNLSEQVSSLTQGQTIRQYRSGGLAFGTIFAGNPSARVIFGKKPNDPPISSYAVQAKIKPGISITEGSVDLGSSGEGASGEIDASSQDISSVPEAEGTGQEYRKSRAPFKEASASGVLAGVKTLFRSIWAFMVSIFVRIGGLPGVDKSGEVGADKKAAELLEQSQSAFAELDSRAQKHLTDLADGKTDIADSALSGQEWFIYRGLKDYHRWLEEYLRLHSGHIPLPEVRARAMRDTIGKNLHSELQAFLTGGIDPQADPREFAEAYVRSFQEKKNELFSLADELLSEMIMEGLFTTIYSNSESPNLPGDVERAAIIDGVLSLCAETSEYYRYVFLSIDQELAAEKDKAFYEDMRLEAYLLGRKLSEGAKQALQKLEELFPLPTRADPRLEPVPVLASGPEHSFSLGKSGSAKIVALALLAVAGIGLSATGASAADGWSAPFDPGMTHSAPADPVLSQAGALAITPPTMISPAQAPTQEYFSILERFSDARQAYAQFRAAASKDRVIDAAEQQKLLSLAAELKSAQSALPYPHTNVTDDDLWKGLEGAIIKTSYHAPGPYVAVVSAVAAGNVGDHYSFPPMSKDAAEEMSKALNNLERGGIPIKSSVTKEGIISYKVTVTKTEPTVFQYYSANIHPPASIDKARVKSINPPKPVETKADLNPNLRLQWESDIDTYVGVSDAKDLENPQDDMQIHQATSVEDEQDPDGPVVMGRNIVSPQAAKPESITAKAPEKLTVHTVSKGDTLRSIANQYFGNPGLWGEVYSPNIGIIGSDPNSLKPGQKLQIMKPAAGSVAESMVVAMPVFDTSGEDLKHYPGGGEADSPGRKITEQPRPTYLTPEPSGGYGKDSPPAVEGESLQTKIKPNMVAGAPVISASAKPQDKYSEIVAMGNSKDSRHARQLLRILEQDYSGKSLSLSPSALVKYTIPLDDPSRNPTLNAELTIGKILEFLYSGGMHIRSLYDETEPSNQEAAAWALGNLAPHIKGMAIFGVDKREVIRGLGEAMNKHPNAQVRRAAAWALRQYADTKNLVIGAEDKDPRMHFYAKSLNDPDWIVRCHVIDGLASIGGTRATGLIVSFLENESEPLVVRKAAQAAFGLQSRSTVLPLISAYARLKLDVMDPEPYAFNSATRDYIVKGLAQLARLPGMRDYVLSAFLESISQARLSNIGANERALLFNNILFPMFGQLAQELGITRSELEATLRSAGQAGSVNSQVIRALFNTIEQRQAKAPGLISLKEVDDSYASNIEGYRRSHRDAAKAVDQLFKQGNRIGLECGMLFIRDMDSPEEAQARAILSADALSRMGSNASVSPFIKGLSSSHSLVRASSASYLRDYVKRGGFIYLGKDGELLKALNTAEGERNWLVVGYLIDALRLVKDTDALEVIQGLLSRHNHPMLQSIAVEAMKSFANKGEDMSGSCSVLLTSEDISLRLRGLDIAANILASSDDPLLIEAVVDSCLVYPENQRGYQVFMAKTREVLKARPESARRALERKISNSIDQKAVLKMSTLLAELSGRMSEAVPPSPSRSVAATNQAEVAVLTAIAANPGTSVTNTLSALSNLASVAEGTCDESVMERAIVNIPIEPNGAKCRGWILTASRIFDPKAIPASVNREDSQVYRYAGALERTACGDSASKQMDTREEAIRALGRMGHEEAVPHLLRLLNSRDMDNTKLFLACIEASLELYAQVPDNGLFEGLTRSYIVRFNFDPETANVFTDIPAIRAHLEKVLEQNKDNLLTLDKSFAFTAAVDGLLDAYYSVMETRFPLEEANDSAQKERFRLQQSFIRTLSFTPVTSAAKVRERIMARIRKGVNTIDDSALILFLKDVDRPSYDALQRTVTPGNAEGQDIASVVSEQLQGLKEADVSKDLLEIEVKLHCKSLEDAETQGRTKVSFEGRDGSNAVQRLLSDPDPEVKIAAAMHLKKLNDPAYIGVLHSALSQELNKRNHLVAAAILRSLSGFVSPVGQPDLRFASFELVLEQASMNPSEGNVSVLTELAFALGTSGDERMVPIAEKLLSNKNELVRAMAVYALDKFFEGSGNISAVSTLIKHAKDGYRFRDERGLLYSERYTASAEAALNRVMSYKAKDAKHTPSIIRAVYSSLADQSRERLATAGLHPVYKKILDKFDPSYVDSGWFAKIESARSKIWRNFTLCVVSTLGLLGAAVASIIGFLRWRSKKLLVKYKDTTNGNSNGHSNGNGASIHDAQLGYSGMTASAVAGGRSLDAPAAAVKPAEQVNSIAERILGAKLIETEDIRILVDGLGQAVPGSDSYSQIDHALRQVHPDSFKEAVRLARASNDPELLRRVELISSERPGDMAVGMARFYTKIHEWQRELAAAKPLNLSALQAIVGICRDGVEVFPLVLEQGVGLMEERSDMIEEALALAEKTISRATDELSQDEKIKADSAGWIEQLGFAGQYFIRYRAAFDQMFEISQAKGYEDPKKGNGFAKNGKNGKHTRTEEFWKEAYGIGSMRRHGEDKLSYLLEEMASFGNKVYPDAYWHRDWHEAATSLYNSIPSHSLGSGLRWRERKKRNRILAFLVPILPLASAVYRLDYVQIFNNPTLGNLIGPVSLFIAFAFSGFIIAAGVSWVEILNSWSSMDRLYKNSCISMDNLMEQWKSSLRGNDHENNDRGQDNRSKSPASRRDAGFIDLSLSTKSAAKEPA